ncbi:hypothetical protein FDO51_RS12595 [Enterococcus hirae]
MQDKIEKLPLNKRFVPVRDFFIDLPDRQQVAFYHLKATRARVNSTLRALVLVFFSRFILANKSIKKELTYAKFVKTKKAKTVSSEWLDYFENVNKHGACYIMKKEDNENE